jgi:hypothetical protein
VSIIKCTVLLTMDIFAKAKISIKPAALYASAGPCLLDTPLPARNERVGRGAGGEGLGRGALGLRDFRRRDNAHA